MIKGEIVDGEFLKRVSKRGILLKTLMMLFGYCL